MQYYDLKVFQHLAFMKAAKSNVINDGELTFDYYKKTAYNYTKITVLTFGDYQFPIQDTFFHTKEKEL